METSQNFVAFSEDMNCRKPNNLNLKIIIEKKIMKMEEPRLMLYTGKFLSEALIFASTNPQYDDRLFIELLLLLLQVQ